jgi:cell division protein FtsI/penicillin-binding protein 2
MKRKIVTGLFTIALTITFIGMVGFALAQNQPADNMEIVKEKIRSDKKLFIATNMQLTESEAKAFWPVYESYQAELGKLRDREIKLIEKFAASYETMSDDAAKSLLEDAMSIDMDHQKLRQSYLAKFRGVLADTKVARYYQLESKIDAVLEYELARRIPLVQ